MKVFVSWSGERSRQAALALCSWMKGVLQNVEPWMSEIDVTAGAVWWTAIMEGLQDTRFCIVCMTPENQLKPWLHFEAGAIAKHLENRTYVCPYLIALKTTEFTGHPLTHFQSKSADEQGTLELLESINKLLDTPLALDTLRQAFTVWWPTLRDRLAAIPPPETPPEVSVTTEDTLAEVLETVRRIENMVAADWAARQMTSIRAEPQALAELYGASLVDLPKFKESVIRASEGRGSSGP